MIVTPFIRTNNVIASNGAFNSKTKNTPDGLPTGVYKPVLHASLHPNLLHRAQVESVVKNTTTSGAQGYMFSCSRLWVLLLLMLYAKGSMGQSTTAHPSLGKQNKEATHIPDNPYRADHKRIDVLPVATAKNVALVRQVNLNHPQAKIAVILAVFAAFLALLANRHLEKKGLHESEVAHFDRYPPESEPAIAKAMLRGAEFERTRLGRELHDGLGGMLAGVKMNLSSMSRQLPKGGQQENNYTAMATLVDNAIAELRFITHNLLPENLYQYGLNTAIANYIMEISTIKQPEISFHFQGYNFRYERELELNIFRIAQELISNAIKHAEATVIQVVLSCQKNRIMLNVTDNGKGFNTKNTETCNNGTGIKNMYNRAMVFHGKFILTSKPKKGTEAKVAFHIKLNTDITKTTSHEKRDKKSTDS